MELIARIDKVSPMKKEDCNVSIGTRIAALIINQLTDRKALYKVEEFYEKQGIASPYGTVVETNDFNDDALSRALDAPYKADLSIVMMQACSRHSTSR